MTRPLLALVVEPGEGRAMRPLVGALGRSVEVRSLGRCALRPDGVLASSSAAARRAPAGVPLATRLDGSVLVAGRRLIVPNGGLDVDSFRPSGPLVRARWRERLGLPPVVVADVATLAPADRQEALRTCSAAVVGAEDLAVALALGTPVITDPAAAAAAGAVDGLHVVVADAGEGLAAAEDLAADRHRCARIGAAGRRLAEERLDLGRAAAFVAAALFVVPPPAGPLGHLESRLQELHLPPVARLRDRVAAALDPLSSGARP